MTREHFCSSVSADAALVIDGMADAVTVARVRAHCAQCPDCAASLEAFIAVRSAVRRMTPEAPSAGFDRNLREALAAHAARKSARARWWPVTLRVAPLAGLCLALAAAYTAGVIPLSEQSPTPVGPVATSGDALPIQIASTTSDIYAHYAWDDPLADRAGIDYDLGTAMAGAFPELE